MCETACTRFVAKSGRKFVVVATSKFFKLVASKRFVLADFVCFFTEKDCSHIYVVLNIDLIRLACFFQMWKFFVMKLLPKLQADVL